MENILTIAVCATMASADGWEDIEAFGEARREIFSTRRIALDILKKDATRKAGVRKKRKIIGWDDNARLDFFRQM